jgi:anaerobic selenocysteine-containing dehydrogenase
MQRRNFLKALAAVAAASALACGGGEGPFADAALSDDRHVAVTTRSRFDRGGRP